MRVRGSHHIYAKGLPPFVFRFRFTVAPLSNVAYRDIS